MGTFLFTLLKNTLGYIGAKLLKPEKLVELLLDLATTLVKRTDTKWDDETLTAIKKALDHED
ncbi:hypothetical protein PYDG_00092 [Pseudoalteromonas phage pYD6-A]|uniref:Uncharacterized protein n=1 Tax=Pseudoalteromonas phage pYD6-A TaxID=754052 RepID=M4SS40_9CAUD|nr:hypothetical protein PYDG_00092 [Pseudoalteromonas phage pYD6-A]AGH57621.1 hypothetical protein PYDG_00092 [Pseudoalteromonas phage pYD6-A]